MKNDRLAKLIDARTVADRLEPMPKPDISYGQAVGTSTFSFVDLAGYSAAAWVHGDDVAARLAIALHDLAREVAGPEDVVIKSIGDAVMCRSVDPRSSLTWHARLFDEVSSVDQQLELRAGCHHGEAVEHEGDFYGTTINVAARIAALAGPCELYATKAVAEAAEALGWAAEPLGSRLLRNIVEPTPVWSIGLPTAIRSRIVDPVCRMRLTPGTGEATAVYADTTYEFCSTVCQAAFLLDPTAYATPYA